MNKDIPEEEPLFSKLTEEEQVAYNELRLLTTTYVSEEVRAECIAELEKAKKTTTRFIDTLRLRTTVQICHGPPKVASRLTTLGVPSWMKILNTRTKLTHVLINDFSREIGTFSEFPDREAI